MVAKKIIEVEGLRVHFDTLDGPIEALQSVDLSVEEGQIMGLVGESGCGKSVTSLVSIGLATCEVDEGSVKYQGEEMLFRETPENARIQSITDRLTAFGVLASIASFFGIILIDPILSGQALLVSASIMAISWMVGFATKGESRKHQKYMRWVRGNEISMIFQEPMSALNPLYTIEKQISEVMREHGRLVQAETPVSRRIGHALASPALLVRKSFLTFPRQSMVVTFVMAVVFAAHLWDSTDPFISYLLYPTKVITVLVLTTMGLFMDAIDSDMVIENPFAMTVIEASIGLFGFILLIVIDVIIMPYYLNRRPDPLREQLLDYVGRTTLTRKIIQNIPLLLASFIVIFLMFWMPLSALAGIVVICSLLALPVIMWVDFLVLDPAHTRQVEGILGDVRIPNPESVAKMYPHELSGGMRQRVMIGMMMACEPKLLIADEPTTALDVTIQAQILKLMKDLRDKKGTAILLITHDLGVIAEMCDDVTVMYAGRVVERAPVVELFDNPMHAYTRGLIACTPNMESMRGSVLPAIPGQVATPSEFVNGCRFCQRMERDGETLQVRPEMVEIEDGHWVESCPICLDESQDRWE
jgi:oligopeptide/dipeptide ABC transporter ATP-binding protein